MAFTARKDITRIGMELISEARMAMISDQLEATPPGATSVWLTEWSAALMAITDLELQWRMAHASDAWKRAVAQAPPLHLVTRCIPDVTDRDFGFLIGVAVACPGTVPSVWDCKLDIERTRRLLSWLDQHGSQARARDVIKELGLGNWAGLRNLVMPSAAEASLRAAIAELGVGDSGATPAHRS